MICNQQGDISNFLFLNINHQCVLQMNDLDANCTKKEPPTENCTKPSVSGSTNNDVKLPQDATYSVSQTALSFQYLPILLHLRMIKL